MIAPPAGHHSEHRAENRPNRRPNRTSASSGPAAPEPLSLATAPRCGARTRQGAPCRSPAVQGRARCRMHGGKGSGAPRGNRNAWKHGGRSAWIRAVARYLRATSPVAIRALLAGGAGAGPAAVPEAGARAAAGAGWREKSKKTNEQPHATETRASAPPAAPGADRPRFAASGPQNRGVAGRAPLALQRRFSLARYRNFPAAHGYHDCPRWTAGETTPNRMGMIDRRQSMALLGSTMLGSVLALGNPALAAPRAKAGGQAFGWDWLKGHAAALARSKAGPLPKPDPRALANTYDAANRISFRPDKTIFADDGYGVRLFPLLKAAPVPVEIAIVENGRAHRLEHSEDMFQVGPGEGPEPHILPGVAGFRVTNRNGIGDWLAFLGASYFRSSGPLHQYGLSARGLAIDTGIDGREEFPAFTHFWLERTRTGLTVYALLQGPSVVGAYRFVNRMEKDAVVQDVSSALWLRKDVQRLGIAPLTSMFWYDEGNPQARADWRPEIHDSDGLLIHNRAGERIWRPLGNPPRPTINAFADSRGGSAFGLLQRDRAFDHYQDDGVFYEKRPSLWVEPQGDWGPGSVMLYEIPTTKETDDNIVAFWTPDRPAKAGSTFAFDYRLRWLPGEPVAASLARVVDRWTGTAGRPGLEPIANARRLVVDFEGPALKGLDRQSGVTAAISIDQGKVLTVDAYPVVGQANRWRMIADVTRSARTANLRATLEKDGRPLSETVIHQFY
ncbi:MAG: glucan biosynthesis protein [Pseudomonadota bacterium]